MSEKKKQGFFSKLFSSKSSDSEKESNSEKKKPPQKSVSSESGDSVRGNAPAVPKPARQSSAPTAASGGGRKPAGRGGAKKQKKSSRKKAKKTGGDLDSVNTNKPLEFPTTPETILAHHKKKPFLSKNEEWLIVELNEFECLVDSLDIIKQIANHSKFFEVEPDKLWEEFFEFVEEMPTYDDIINLDVWQEFRDTKYPC